MISKDQQNLNIAISRAQGRLASLVKEIQRDAYSGFTPAELDSVAYAIAEILDARARR